MSVSPTPNSSASAVPPVAPPPASPAPPPPPVVTASPPKPAPPPDAPPSPPPPPPPVSPSPPPPLTPSTPPQKNQPPSSPSPPPSAPSTTSPPTPQAKPPKSPPPPRRPPINPPQTPSPPPPAGPSKTSPSPPPEGPPQRKPPPPLPPPTPDKPPKSSDTPPQSSSSPPPPRTPTKSPPPPALAPTHAAPPASPNSTSDFVPPPSPIFASSSTPLPSTPASPGSPASVLDSTGNSSPGTVGIVVIIAVLSILFLSFIGFAIWCLKKRRKQYAGLNGGYAMPSPSASSCRSDSSAVKSLPSVPLLGSSSGIELVNSPRKPSALGNSGPWFTYQQLVEATNGFSPQNLLGEGGFGSVYKGHLPDGREIAVKQLKVGGGQGEREFKAEVEIISRIHHRHLVSLVGYCIADTRRLLVYEFVSNNTLYFHLHEGRPVLDWAKRIKIAAGAARGLAYLHEDCHPRIIHRDIKSANILLDNNFEARVSDFGLAKLAVDTHVTTRVMGTFGYMAPEYALSGKLTEKSDVYSFGVVLLELITGRKPVDTSQPLGDESLVEWARPLLSRALDKEEFQGLADPRLENNFVESEMCRIIEAAAACVRHSAAKRPRMGQVVRAFDNLATTDLANGMRVGESTTYNSAEQSAEIRLFRRMAFGSQNYSTESFSRTNSNI